jgi:hypothetical protein
VAFSARKGRIKIMFAFQNVIVVEMLYPLKWYSPPLVLCTPGLEVCYRFGKGSTPRRKKKQ